MKQPRRWVALFAALMMAASLVATPRVGMGGVPDRPIDNADPPMMGDPDIPAGSPQSIVTSPEWLWALIRLQWLAITKGSVGLDVRAARPVARLVAVRKARDD